MLYFWYGQLIPQKLATLIVFIKHKFWPFKILGYFCVFIFELILISLLTFFIFLNPFVFLLITLTTCSIYIGGVDMCANMLLMLFLLFISAFPVNAQGIAIIVSYHQPFFENNLLTCKMCTYNVTIYMLIIYHFISFNKKKIFFFVSVRLD